MTGMSSYLINGRSEKMKRSSSRLVLQWGAALLLALSSWGVVRAADPEVIKLWPKGAPNAKAGMAAEQVTTKAGGLYGTQVSVTNVSEPTLTVFLPPRDQACGAAVIVCPGGGYTYLEMSKEGTDLAKWFNTFGVAAMVLKYRVPNDRDGALQDIQRALRIVRSRAAGWGVDTRRVGVMGFSAGAHLSARVSNNYGKAAYDAVDQTIDQAAIRPDFAMIIYPGLLAQGRSGQLAPDMPVTAQTPPTFVAQAYDDRVGVENSIYYFAALQKAGVPQCEMHLYANGGHGFGLHTEKDGKSFTNWAAQCRQWMTDQGWLKVTAKEK